MKKLAIFLGVSLFSIAAIANAQTLNEAANNIQRIISTLTTAAYLLAFLAFFWGLARYLFAGGDDAKKGAVKTMIMSVVVIFIMTSIWGIVKVLQGTLGIRDNQAQDVEINLPNIRY